MLRALIVCALCALSAACSAPTPYADVGELIVAKRLAVIEP